MSGFTGTDRHQCLRYVLTILSNKLRSGACIRLGGGKV